MLRRRFGIFASISMLLLAAVEVAAHFGLQRTKPEDAHWRAAGQFVRENWQSTDAVEAAPGWMDPLVRREIGDLISLAAAGPSDLAGFRRLWVFQWNNENPGRFGTLAKPPTWSRDFGNIRLMRFDLPTPTISFDFVDKIASAQVVLEEEQEEKRCPWRSNAAARGGALGAGPMTPRARFECDPRRPWLWVGQTIQEDLELEPRFCAWQHPAEDGIVRVSFSDVPLDRWLVLYGGIYYEHERMREGGPVSIAVRVGDEEIARMTHRDGNGWSRMVADLSDSLSRNPNRRADVSFEVTSPAPHKRSFCWAASLRSEAP